MRTVSEPIYEYDLVKNMTMKICDDVTNTSPNSIYIPINVCLEGYNKYELCAFMNSGCSICLGKTIIIFRIYIIMWKKNPRILCK